MTNNKYSNEMKKKSFRDNIIIYFLQIKLTHLIHLKVLDQIFSKLSFGHFSLVFKNFLNMY